MVCWWGGHICWWEACRKAKEWTQMISILLKMGPGSAQAWEPWAGACSECLGECGEVRVRKQSWGESPGERLRDRPQPRLGNLQGQGRGIYVCSHRLGTWPGSFEQTSLWEDHSKWAILSGENLKYSFQSSGEMGGLDRGRWVSGESWSDSGWSTSDNILKDILMSLRKRGIEFDSRVLSLSKWTGVFVYTC